MNTFSRILIGALLLGISARAENITADPAVAARIRQRIADQRAFMEYQLQMTEIMLTIQEYFNRHQLDLAQFPVTDAELAELYQAHYAGRPDVPAKFADVPAEAQAQIRRQLQLQKQSRAIEALATKLRAEIPVEINQPAIDAVSSPSVVREP